MWLAADVHDIQLTVFESRNDADNDSAFKKYLLISTPY